jgi:hypothetical protein
MDLIAKVLPCLVDTGHHNAVLLPDPGAGPELGGTCMFGTLPLCYILVLLSFDLDLHFLYSSLLCG